MHDRAVILTDGEGRPIPRPERPGRFATVNEWYDYHQALCRYNDAVAATANKAFAEAFGKEFRRG